MTTLELKDVHIAVEGKEIVKGLTLTVKSGEIHALMGPNGSGKSTLSYTIMGHPKYQVTKGSILFDGQDLQLLKPNERAKLGLFLSFQYPQEVPGVKLTNFLLHSYKARHGNITPLKFRDVMKQNMDALKMDGEFSKRSLNEGFSGGEKKRCEIFQMAVLKPKISILDETDSGLDVDALRIVSTAISSDKEMGVLLITHYNRILQYVKPHYVHVMASGKIIKSGGHDLSLYIEENGYEKLLAGG